MLCRVGGDAHIAPFSKPALTLEQRDDVGIVPYTKKQKSETLMGSRLKNP